MQNIIDGMSIEDTLFKGVMLAEYMMEKREEHGWRTHEIWSDQMLINMLYCRELPLWAIGS